MKKQLKQKLQHLHSNVFVGRHSIIIVAGFTVGATIIARSLWQFLYDSFGLWWTMLAGFIIFVFSGLYMHKFYDITKYEDEDLI